MNKRSYPKPYKRGSFWYISFQRDGVRRRMSTGFTTLREAEAWVRRFVDEQDARRALASSTLRTELEKYRNAATNPRRRDKLFAGQSYTLRYAEMVARHATALVETLPPKLLDSDIRDIRRIDIKDASLVIMAKFGRTQKASKMYKLLKVALKQACDDGYAETSPAVGLPDIKPERGRATFALPSEEIAIAIQHPELASCRAAYLLFVIMATTGMRRAEALAVTSSQIDGNALLIDRAYKDDSLRVIGLPKWGKVRAIYLADISRRALSELLSIGGGSVPRISTRTLRLWFKTIGIHAAGLDDIAEKEAWQSMTPHILRHSLNTALRLEGLPDMLVAEYMSWQHQEAGKMQERYTHIYARNLKPIADAIDRLYGQLAAEPEKQKAAPKGGKGEHWLRA